MVSKTTSNITKAALIAALYVALGIIFAPISFLSIQMRVSEAFTLLPVYSPVAIWGVTLGCAISNAYGAATGMSILGAWDILFGTFATLIAGIMTYKLRKITYKGIPFLAPLPPIIINGIVLGLEFSVFFTGGFDFGVFMLNAGQIALGQFIPCYVLGLIMIISLDKTGVSKKLF